MIQSLVRKIKIVLGMLRGIRRNKIKPVITMVAVTGYIRQVQFLNDAEPTRVLIECKKFEYHYYNGRCYQPSGLYKQWILTYQDTSKPHLGGQCAMVYPSPHLLINIVEHYVQYIQTQVNPSEYT